MIKVSPDTEDWHLAAYMKWTPIPHDKTCPGCNGGPGRGYGFFDDEDRQTCFKCNNTGRITEYGKSPEPKLPEGLTDHMREAWDKFFSLQTINSTVK